MLGIMRKYKSSILIKVVFVIIILSFVVGFLFIIMGRDELGLGKSANYAIKVDGTTISFSEFQQSYERVKAIYGRNLPPELEKQLKLKELVQESLIEEALKVKAARSMGIRVSDDELRAEIDKMPTFQRNGSFDQQQYFTILRQNRITPDAFEKKMKESLLVRKALSAVQDKVTVSDADALQAFKKQNDKIELLFTSFAPADMTAGLTLSRQELESYLQNHQAEFRTPERVSVSYLLIDPRKLTAGLTINSEEAESYYQKNIDRYQGKGGILPYAEVQARAKADALQLKAVKQAYEMAADAINKHQKDADPSAVAKALGLPLFTTPLFTAKEQPPQLAGETEVLTKAFFLQPGQLGGPVETKKGVYILALKERQPATVPPLAAVKGAVERGATVEKAQQLASKKAEEAQTALAKGTGTLKLQETGMFGYSNTSVIPKIGKAPAIMETAFTLTTASPAPPNPFKIGERWYAVRLKGRTEANTADFQKVKEQLKQQMLPQKREEALKIWLVGLKKKAKIVINPALAGD